MVVIVIVVVVQGNILPERRSAACFLNARGTLLLFSPAGRRWPEGSDEGAARHALHDLPFACAPCIRGSPLTPSSGCRHLLPAGEKQSRGNLSP
ncbi:hypothetical protein RHE_CH02784 [Rhizobium etli CFN 42]|uniref:Uncharacterized protein n=1 Tax=Rhizobium etli (strain ATCC 51251 / DSM 11541 / JCM 21823 / NBRC 15573 / CFN 42) TaxID=347834 RepID=Q2K6I3_RHIEC|nr:hypothetical protein RHE_CH02784 [Rhizobium etli CFN 42]